MLDGSAPAGIYRGTIDDRGRRRDAASVPVELEVLDFALPDENSMHAMLFYSERSARAYHGRNLDPAYHRFAHRHRVELVNAYDETDAAGRRGAVSRARTSRAPDGYEGPGRGRGQRAGAAQLLWAGRQFDDRAERVGAQRRVDDVSPPEAAARHHVPLYAGRAACLGVPADPWRSPTTSIPTPARAGRCPIFVTSAYAEGLDAAIDIWDTGPQGFQARSRRERTRAAAAATGSITAAARPAGAITIDAPATDARATIWAAFKHDVRGVLLLARRPLAAQLAEGRRRATRTCGPTASRSTTGRQPTSPPDDQGYIHGDGVLLYPGEERLHPDEDRGIAGPIATMQLANLRRGLQDHQYLTLARSSVLTRWSPRR